MGIVMSGRNLSHLQKEELVSFLKINLSRKVGREKKEIFLSINEKNFKSVSEYFFIEVRKIFSHIFFPVEIKKSDVGRFLKISLNSLKKDYFFSEAMKIAKSAIQEGEDYDLIPELIYDIQGPELSEKEREAVLLYARFDYESGLRINKRNKMRF